MGGYCQSLKTPKTQNPIIKDVPFTLGIIYALTGAVFLCVYFLFQFFIHSGFHGDSAKIYQDALAARGTVQAFQITARVFSAVGIVFVLIGAVFIGFRLRQKKTRRHARKYGIRLDAEITRIALNPFVSSGRAHPFVLECRCQAADGTVRRFKSGPIWYDPAGFLRSGHVSVYVEPENYRKYYVDLSSVLPEEK